MTLLLALLIGCAPSLLDRPQDDGTPGTDTSDTSDTGPAAPLITTTDLGDGSYLTLADATDYLNWIYFSFSAGQVATPAVPEDDPSWDLGFERYLVKLNGGVSGTGAMVATVLAEADFDSIDAAPEDAVWVDDLPDDDDENSNPEYALGDWFDYTTDDHALTPSDLCYVVRAVDNTIYKLQFKDYYDDAGTPGYLSFRWAALSSTQDTGGGGSDSGS